ncbi:general substrate transporter [Sistotremastrum suecicum HHB10207 ss-3]|uniref:General substrate transporter n=1 Tax=Sistotremastrum suecicum HHB10207 ss-3 TaxID=1314776 RepID=A0A166BCR0_9AGAM|nr:general substrate transporter [Sistotremastrum suecicum HHB10207 ss-3]
MAMEQRTASSHSSLKKEDSTLHVEKAEGNNIVINTDIDLVEGQVKIKEAHNAEFEAAKIAGTLNPWSKESLALYGCAAICFLCSCGNGYDGSLMTAINAMPFYQSQFNSGRLGPTTGIIFSIYTIGQMAGSFFGGPICDRWGRRAGMFVGCFIIMCGSATIASASLKSQFIAGRFILGMGISIAIIGAPTYCVEIAPPQWRGRMTALYNTGWNGGAIPAAAICLGTSGLQSNWSWRIPLILQALPAFIVCCVVWFLPESPRYLVANSRDKEAYDFLVRYHGNNDPNNPIVQLQMKEFKEKIRIDASDKRWWDFRDLFMSHNARWRSSMVILMGIFGQMSGNGLGYFNLDISKSLGYGTHMQFVLNLIGPCINIFVAWAAVSLSDRMPRRKILVFGTLACSVLLAANAACSAKWASYGIGPKNNAVGQAGLAFFFLFGFAFAFTYTPLQALYPAECLETTARAKGISMKLFVISATSFINLLCIPIALQRIKWKLILIFVFWDAFEVVVWYFCAVETVGYTLEELEDIFSAPYPPGASRQKQKIAVNESGVVAALE